MSEPLLRGYFKLDIEIGRASMDLTSTIATKAYTCRWLPLFYALTKLRHVAIPSLKKVKSAKTSETTSCFYNLNLNTDDHRRTGTFGLGGPVTFLPEKNYAMPESVRFEIGMQSQTFIIFASNNHWKNSLIESLHTHFYQQSQCNLKRIKRKSSSFHGVFRKCQLLKGIWEVFTFRLVDLDGRLTFSDLLSFSLFLEPIKSPDSTKNQTNFNEEILTYLTFM